MYMYVYMSKLRTTLYLYVYICIYVYVHVLRSTVTAVFMHNKLYASTNPLKSIEAHASLCASQAWPSVRQICAILTGTSLHHDSGNVNKLVKGKLVTSFPLVWSKLALCVVQA